MTHRKEKSAYREKKKLLTVQRKKCLPRRENFAYQAEKKLLTAGCKISLPRTQRRRRPVDPGGGKLRDLRLLRPR